LPRFRNVNKRAPSRSWPRIPRKTLRQRIRSLSFPESTLHLQIARIAFASAATPGGTLKVAAASSRSVSMNETFPRPLVIGYVGFGLPIFENGEPGSLIPTQAALQRKKIIPAHVATFTADTKTQVIQTWLKKTRIIRICCVNSSTTMDIRSMESPTS